MSSWNQVNGRRGAANGFDWKSKLNFWDFQSQIEVNTTLPSPKLGLSKRHDATIGVMLHRSRRAAHCHQGSHGC